MAPNLPVDIIHEIIQRLPIKSLLRFKCVCKAWNDIINTSNFINSNSFLTFAHNSCLYQVYDFDKSSTTTKLTCPNLQFSRVIGSCNGLICVHCKDGSLALCNPSTRTLKKVPNLNSTQEHIRLGFGYDHLGNDYKIISLLDKSVYVYSLKSNSWKEGKPCMIMSGKYFYGSDHGMLANTHLHWIQYDQVISFDLQKESWESLELPKNKQYNKDGFWLMHVGLFKGCLNLQVAVNDPTNPGVSRSDIWIMKEYGKSESWTKLFSYANDIKLPFSYCKGFEVEMSLVKIILARIYLTESNLREGKREDWVEFVKYGSYGCYGGVVSQESLTSQWQYGNGNGNGNGGELIRLVGEQVDLDEELEKKNVARKRKNKGNHQVSQSRSKRTRR